MKAHLKIRLFIMFDFIVKASAEQIYNESHLCGIKKVKNG